MADMKTRKSSKRRRLTDEEVDHTVISQAETEAAWEAPIEVRKARRGSFSIPRDLTERAAFLARMHRAAGPEEWLTRVVRERIELEEVAFAAVKRELSAKEERPASR